MPRLFVPSDAVGDGAVEIDGQAARHLAASLRLRVGEEFRIVADEIEYTVRASDVSSDRVTGVIASQRPARGEAALHVEVIQALPKDGMGDAIDAMVQAGVATIRPVVSGRVVARPDEDRAAKRVQRWRDVARETAQLAFRARVPEICDVVPLAVALEALPRGTRLLACALAPGAEPLASIGVADDGAVAVCIGPEGGFDERDIKTLALCGAELVHLGPRVFRARDAGAIAATLLMARTGNLHLPGDSAVDGDADPTTASRRG